jgi:hypothetical protein
VKERSPRSVKQCSMYQQPAMGQGVTLAHVPPVALLHWLLYRGSTQPQYYKAQEVCLCVVTGM